MSATADQIVTLRRLIAEPTDATYTDVMVVAAIEARPVRDANGYEPLKWDYTTTPPSQVTNPDWTATFDLNAAAADIWDEKAAAVACDFNFSADGASYNRQQVFDHYERMARKYRSKARIGSTKLRSTQREVTRDGYIVENTGALPQYDAVVNR